MFRKSWDTIIERKKNKKTFNFENESKSLQWLKNSLLRQILIKDVAEELTLELSRQLDEGDV